MRNLARRHSVEMAGLLFFVYGMIFYYFEPQLRYVSIWILHHVRENAFWSDAMFEKITNYIIFVSEDKLDISIVAMATVAAFVTLRKLSK